nr:DNA helicase [Tanacetum cinerariifolium]
MCNAGEIPSLKIRLYNNGGARGYELPTSDVFGEIVFEDGPKSRTNFDVIIKFRGGPPQGINKLHQSYMSLQFPLLFVFGEPRFYPELVLKPRDGSGKGKKVTMNAYYKYQLYPRVKGFGLIFRGGHLFQQYVIVAFCATEQSRLDFIRKRHNDLRSDYLLDLYDAISQGGCEGIQAGSMIILLGNPQFLITFTCNVKWTEIKRYMSQYPGLTPTDRAYIDAYQIDEYIFAELPNPVEDPKGYKVMSKLMMHGPCGVANPSASCTEKGICNKHFINMYNDKTYFDTNGYTHYRRRQTQVHVMKGESRLDNCNVVPYNRILCLAFRAYINFEYCGWSMLIKYLFKYISKGSNRILGKINRSIEDASTSTGKRHIQVDEIQNYAVCEALGLLGDDREWDIALEESVVSASSAQLRTLFAQVLIYDDVPAGRITHFRFKLPLELTGESVCHAKKHSQLGNFLVETNHIIWNEAPMNDRRCFKALDRTLRDLMNARETLFGGKTVVLVGDFRHTLLVKKGAAKQDLIHAAIAKSYLWVHFRICVLKQNMRLLRSAISDDEWERLKVFAKWLLDLGNGEVGEPDKDKNEDTFWITVPQQYCINPSEHVFSELINFIYDDAILKTPTASAF